MIIVSKNKDIKKVYAQAAQAYAKECAQTCAQM